MGGGARWLALAGGLALMGFLAGCGGDPTPDGGTDLRSDETAVVESGSEPGSVAAPDESGEDAGDEPAGLPPPGGGIGDEAGDGAGDGVGERESTLIAAIAEHIGALNALDREAFIGRYLDDCGDPEAAGSFSYEFGAPLVEAGGMMSAEFESIVFLDNDRAAVEYEASLPSEVWVVVDEEWWISTCPR